MRSKAYFEAVAGDWDAMRSEFFSEAVRDIAIQQADLEPGCISADVGAGSGFITAGLLALGHGVIALDASPAMLTELERRFPGAPNLSCQLSDMENLALADQSVERVFANMALHHAERPWKAIAEMARILKPGGRVLITDLDAHQHQFLHEEHHDHWLGFEHGQLTEWFEAAGLHTVSVANIGES